MFSAVCDTHRLKNLECRLYWVMAITPMPWFIVIVFRYFIGYMSLIAVQSIER